MAIQISKEPLKTLLIFLSSVNLKLALSLNKQCIASISVYVETARQQPGATVQIQTSAATNINRSWKIKTISLECETAWKYELYS